AAVVVRIDPLAREPAGCLRRMAGAHRLALLRTRRPAGDVPDRRDEALLPEERLAVLDPAGGGRGGPPARLGRRLARTMSARRRRPRRANAGASTARGELSPGAQVGASLRGPLRRRGLLLAVTPGVAERVPAQPRQHDHEGGEHAGDG